MSSVRKIISSFNDSGQQGIKIKNEPGAICGTSDELMSCVFNSESPTPKTILITNSYSPANKANAVNNTNINTSSIRIFTHSESEGSSTCMPSSSGGGVVVDRINILINNHFNEPPMAPVSSSPAAEAATGIGANMPESAAKTDQIRKTTEVAIDGDVLVNATKATHQYEVGNDVFVQEKDARFYLGTILATDLTQCWVQFRDNSKRWAAIDDLTLFNAEDTSPVCVVCKSESDPETVEVCEKCGRGYHHKCADASNGVWLCRRGHRNLLNSLNKETQELTQVESAPSDLKKLPYDISSLTWDKKYRQNHENVYCYCGKNGTWYMQMLQCARCRQWFHGTCIKSLQYPLYYGDRFYIFVCSLCNHGTEFLRKLHMQIEDIIHLFLFNLNKHHNLDYYHVKAVIVPYAQSNWHYLQLHRDMRNMSFSDIKQIIVKALSSNEKRFKCLDAEAKMKYGLHVNVPPPVVKLVLPPNGPQVTEKYLKEYFKEKTKIQILPVVRDFVRFGAECSYTMSGKGYLSNNNPKSPIPSTSTSYDIDIESEDEVLANFAVKLHSVQENTLPPTPPTSESLTTTPNDFEMDWSLDTNDDNKDEIHEEVLSKAHRRKNYVTFVPDLSEHLNLSEDTSQGALDLIIPPSRSYKGVSNPYYSLTTKCSTKPAAGGQPPSNGQLNNFPSQNSQVRIVRTIKRRLSARDIGLNVKRRKLNKRSSDNYEIISTETIHVPKTTSKRTDFKELSLVRPTLASSASSSSSLSSTPLATTPTTPLPPIVNMSVPSPPPPQFGQSQNLGGRRLRKRAHTIYVENPKRLLTTISSSSSSLSSMSNTSSSNVPDLTQLNGDASSASSSSMADIQSTVCMFFGIAYRNGVPYTICAKRTTLEGFVEYLTKWRIHR